MTHVNETICNFMFTSLPWVCDIMYLYIGMTSSCDVIRLSIKLLLRLIYYPDFKYVTIPIHFNLIDDSSFILCSHATVLVLEA